MIAHKPHMIDVDVMRELQARYQAEFDNTSSHHFRDPRDMQYAFSYMYYIAGVHVPFNATEAWYTFFDHDHDDVLSPFEHRVLALVLCDSQYNPSQVDEAAKNITDMCANGTLPLTRTQFEHCDELLAALNATSTFRDRKRYAYQQRGDEDVLFVSLTTDLELVEQSMRQFLLHPTKWMCLNDDLDHTDPASRRVVRRVHEFYDFLFPTPSQFEYHDSTRNELLHVSDIVAAQQHQRRTAAVRLTVILLAQLLLLLAVLAAVRLRLK